MSSKTHPANRRQPAQPRRKTRPTPTKTVSGIPYWPSRDPIGERGGKNLYGFVGNDGVRRWDRLGLYCVQTSFRWTTEPMIVNSSLNFKGLGEGAQILDSITAFWEGVAEVGCCCDWGGNRRFNASGKLVATSNRNTNADNLLLTGGNPMPAITVPAPSSIGKAIGQIIKGFVGKVGAPGSLEDEIQYLAGEVEGILEDMKNVIPTDFKWKDGWPCH